MLGEDIIEAAWIIAWTSYLYYDETACDEHETNNTPISDLEYDALSQLVANDWSELTEDLQKLLGSPDEIRASGHHIKMTRAQTKEAERVTHAAMKRIGRCGTPD